MEHTARVRDVAGSAELLSGSDPTPRTSRSRPLLSICSPVLALLVALTGCGSIPVDLDGDGYSLERSDCNDADAQAYPGALEQCDGIDNNCDNVVDEGSDDLDGDGSAACVDCDDADAEVYPGALEACDAADNDCNDLIDEGDQDGNGLADCQEADQDGDGYTELEGDCGDGDPATSPDGDEVCDGGDNDCDGDEDEIYPDQDHDGSADCVDLDADDDGFTGVGPSTDCDDRDSSTFPGATEACDGADNDCDGQIDEGYSDYDQDTSAECVDCDDENPAVHPGAEDVCNGIDDDCDDAVDDWYGDEDGDGFGLEDPEGFVEFSSCSVGEGVPLVPSRGDCDDRDSARYPGAPDAGGDGIDQDCGGTDEAEPHVGLSTETSVTLAAALTEAQPGTTVWVGPSTYYEHDLAFSQDDALLKSVRSARETVIDAELQGRAFSFGDTSAATNLTLDGLTIRNGRADFGGAILVNAAQVTLEGCVIAGSSSTGTVIVGGTEWSGGGGIGAISGRLFLNRCRLTGNDSSAYGGAMVLLANSNATITRSTLADNMASQEGGGLFIQNSIAEISSASILNNQGQGGGGIGVNGINAKLTLESVYIAFNQAIGPDDPSGGGMDITDIPIDKSVLIDNCRFEGNLAENNGGALRVENDAVGDIIITPVEITNTLFLENVAGDAGAVDLVVAAVNMTNVIFDGNFTSGEGDGFGGALRFKDSSTDLDFITIVRNSAVAGAAAYYDGDNPDLPSPSIESSIIAYNWPDNLAMSESVPVIPHLDSSDLYNPPDWANSPSQLESQCLNVEPGFLSYEDSFEGYDVPTELHLSLTSPLLEAGRDATCTETNSDGCDPDGTLPQSGAYGGPGADDWDLDDDGYPDYFWPGTIDDAPAGFAPSDYDCDDLDPSRQR